MDEKLQIIDKLYKKYAKLGLTDIKVGDIELKFAPIPKRSRASKNTEEIKSESISDEDLLFWSSQPNL